MSTQSLLIKKPTVVEPGGLIGILGGGQLGRMTAMAARTMGYRVRVMDPEAQVPRELRGRRNGGGHLGRRCRSKKAGQRSRCSNAGNRADWRGRVERGSASCAAPSRR